MRFYDAILTSKQLVVGHCSAARRTSSTEKSEDHWMQETMILYPVLLILRVHIFVPENTKAIKKNKVTMTW